MFNYAPQYMFLILHYHVITNLLLQCVSGPLQEWKGVALSSPPGLNWSTLEQCGCLLLWAVSSCSALTAPSATSTTAWPSVCLATTRTSSCQRSAETAGWSRLFFHRRPLPTLTSASLLGPRQSVTFLMPGFYGWMSDTEKKAGPFSDSQAEVDKSRASFKMSEKYGERCMQLWRVYQMGVFSQPIWSDVSEWSWGGTVSNLQNNGTKK